MSDLGYFTVAGQCHLQCRCNHGMTMSIRGAAVPPIVQRRMALAQTHKQTDRPDSGAASDEELSALANNLVDLWKRILRIEDITLDDDFFELGGNSLSAIRLLPVIEDHFGVEPHISLVFDHPTPRQMAEALATIGAVADQRPQDAL
jgi:acyl carrier protein